MDASTGSPLLFGVTTMIPHGIVKWVASMVLGWMLFLAAVVAIVVLSAFYTGQLAEAEEHIAQLEEAAEQAIEMAAQLPACSAEVGLLNAKLDAIGEQLILHGVIKTLEIKR